MDDSTNAPEKPDPTPFLVSDRASLSTFIAGCEHAQTLAAYSAAEKTDVVISLRCNQWSCRYCAEAKIRRLAAMTRDAQPNRLLTLTVDPKLWSSPREAFDGTRSKIPDFFAILRKKFGEVEYLRATELTRKGWPHYHFLVRSKYLPHASLKKIWSELTGATILDVRTVQKSFSAYKYLVKYLAKLHSIQWTERHVSYSRRFFPPEPSYERRSLDLINSYSVNCHPVTYLLENCHGCSITRITPTVFGLTGTNSPPEEF